MNPPYTCTNWCFTPGPWSVFENNSAFGITGNRTEDSLGDCMYAVVGTNESCGIRDCADATLIASAPDLLFALSGLVMAVKTTCETDITGLLSMYIEVADEVLNKATGATE